MKLQLWSDINCSDDYILMWKLILYIRLFLIYGQEMIIIFIWEQLEKYAIKTQVILKELQCRLLPLKKGQNFKFEKSQLMRNLTQRGSHY